MFYDLSDIFNSFPTLKLVKANKVFLQRVSLFGTLFGRNTYRLIPSFKSEK